MIMKKLFSVFAMLLAGAALMVSCDSGGDDNNGGGNETPKDTFRVKSFSLVGDGWADVYQYTYDATGRVTRIFREEGKDYNFAYSGQGITITNTGNPFATIELNAQSYISKMTDEWGDVREYIYNAEGHMTQIKKNGEAVSTITLEQGCIASWTRMKDGELQTKTHTYTATPNTHGMQNIHSEATDPSRWMYETGLFGKPSVYLCASSRWAHSDIASTYEYEQDANGCVTKESKNYGGEMEYFEYTWEKVEAAK